MTPLKDPVFRSSGVTVNGRELVAGLELMDGIPVLSLRLKGQKSGWHLELE